MSLNIKNEETHRLVRRLAELTGQSQTGAVEDAVRRRLDELDADGEQARRLRLLTDIAARAGAALDSDWRNTDWDAELYDENGLPR